MTLLDRHLDTARARTAEVRKENGSEIRTGDFVESLERFQHTRAVIEDFTSRTLAAIPSEFGRLYYISSLKDSNSGRYEHEGLMNLYSEGAVQAAITHCHQELFSRILETPLREQERDLRMCLDVAGEKFWEVVESWSRTRYFQEMCPDGLPDYLHDLFCSNVASLLAIFSFRRSN